MGQVGLKSESALSFYLFFVLELCPKFSNVEILDLILENTRNNAG